MRRVIVGAFITMVVTIIGLFPGGVALAHTLEQNNGVAAVLHIAPDDDPVAGVDTVMYFDFTAQDPSFDVRYCGCRLSFQSSENRLVSAGLQSSNDAALSGHTSVKFEKAGVYDLKLVGYTSDKLNTTFSLDFRTRVEPGVTAADAAARRTAGVQVILLAVTSLVLLSIVASEAIRRGKRYAKK